MKFRFQLNLIPITGDSRAWWLFSDQQGSEQPHPPFRYFHLWSLSAVSSIFFTNVPITQGSSGGYLGNLPAPSTAWWSERALSRIHVRNTSVFPDQQLFHFSLYFCDGSYKFPSWPQTHYHGWSQTISNVSFFLHLPDAGIIGMHQCAWLKQILSVRFCCPSEWRPCWPSWKSLIYTVPSALCKTLQLLSCSFCLSEASQISDLFHPWPLCSWLLRLLPKRSGLGVEVGFLACDPVSFQSALCIYTQFSGLVNFLLAPLAGQSP